VGETHELDAVATVTDVRVRKAGAADIDNAAAALADAFADYAWTRWTVDAGDHRARIYGLQRLVIERIALPYGEVWVAEDAHGEIASAAIWMVPGSSVPDQVSEGAAAAQRELEGNRHDASMRAEAACESLRPAAPHYYLGAVGTRYANQRQGLATAVLAPVLERAEAERAMAFLETSDPTKVAFYERLGFAISGEVDVPDGGPHVWAMARRSARRRSVG
jgi:GNAT superfamily N-acetyltransferase